MNAIYLISGVPCCGKTSFGDWLRDNRGFVHVDLESEQFRQSCIGLMWNRLIDAKVPQLIPCELKKLHPRVVLTWGFPLSCVQIIKGLETGGASAWWFEGDLNKARELWISREGREPQGAEQDQFDNLKTRNSEFLEPFGKCIVRTLDRKGYTASFEQIATLLGIPDYP